MTFAWLWPYILYIGAAIGSLPGNHEREHVYTPPPRAMTLVRIWLLVLGCAWLLAGFFVGSGTGGSHWWGIVLVAVGVLHFAAARYATKRLAMFFS
jgi:hypothetical protein